MPPFSDYRWFAHTDRKFLLDENIPSGQVRHGAFAFVLELHASDLSGATSFLGNQALARLNAGLFISSDITDGRFSRAGKSPGKLNSSIAARVPRG